MGLMQSIFRISFVLFVNDTATIVPWGMRFWCWLFLRLPFMAALPATPFRSLGLSAVTVGSTFWAKHGFLLVKY